MPLRKAETTTPRPSWSIAPNVIVFERLRTDFGGGRIFRSDPVIPPELRIFWDLDCYMRGDAGARQVGGRALSHQHPAVLSSGQLAARSNEPDVMTDVLGPAPALRGRVDRLRQAHRCRGVPCMVLNDEGHHTHDEDSEWNRVIRRLHHATPSRPAAQLDSRRRPATQKGGLFTWTVFDYPLKQAIIDNVVKQPDEGHDGRHQGPTVRHRQRPYQAYLTAGVERWREYRSSWPSRQEADPLRDAQQHRRGRRRRRLPAREIP